MKKCKWWFNVVAGFGWILAADAAFFVLTGMTFFDPDTKLRQMRFCILLVIGFGLGIFMISGSHLKEDKS